MGCDIHMMAQKKTRTGWEVVECPPEYRDEWIVKQAAETGGQYYLDRLPYAWDIGRNYPTFAVLADVRNGYGFAGVTTHAPLVPIAQPRGLPAGLVMDADDPDCLNGVWLGDHSHSWLTLRELEEFDWDQTLIRTGIVAFGQFRERCEEYGIGVPVAGRPYKEWCGGISGPGIYVMDAPEAIDRMHAGGVVESLTQRPHVRDQWSESLRDACSQFCERVLPALRLIGGPDEVRIVFGFDS